MQRRTVRGRRSCPSADQVRSISDAPIYFAGLRDLSLVRERPFVALGEPIVRRKRRRESQYHRSRQRIKSKRREAHRNRIFLGRKRQIFFVEASRSAVARARCGRLARFAPPDSAVASDAKALLQRVAHRLRVRFAAGRLHHLTDEPAEHSGLRPRRLGLVGVRGDDGVDGVSIAPVSVTWRRPPVSTSTRRSRPCRRRTAS